MCELDLTAQFKLIELRREIERILVTRAARLADPAVCRNFRSLAKRFEEAQKKNDASIFIPADAEFNQLLAITADNEFAAAAMAPLQAQTRRLWFLYYKEFGDIPTVARLHADIARAIADKDEKKARTASDALIEYVEDYTYRTINMLKKRE